jgi:predicted transposase/invertase (TIGR01784 family)
LLADFLNSLLPQSSQLVSLQFKNTEQSGMVEGDRKAIYDIYCENEKGEKFIVELQKAKQNYFKERTIYYSTFPIREQAERGDWAYTLKAVYCVGILDFTFDDYANEAEQGEVVHCIQLKNQHGQVFYDKLTYVYLEMPNFKKNQASLESRLDKWLYFIKHLEDFQSIPAIFSDDIFTRAFEKAELAKLDAQEMQQYEMNLKVYRDYKNTIESAFGEGKMEGWVEGKMEGLKEGLEEGLTKGKLEGLEEGLTKGKLEGILSVAKALKNSGVPNLVIANTTGLSEPEVESL